MATDNKKHKEDDAITDDERSAWKRWQFYRVQKMRPHLGWRALTDANRAAWADRRGAAVAAPTKRQLREFRKLLNAGVA